jgi:Swt1-like HEPN
VAQTNREIRIKVLAALGVSPQRLSQLVKDRKRELPMSTPHAVYTIAHEQGIDIAKYLDPEEVGEVRRLLTQLGGRERLASRGESPRGGGGRRKPAPKEVKVTIAGVDVGKIPALSRAHAEDAKRMSERVYPTLYIFENSVRDVIERVLRAKHGDWWREAVPKSVRETAQRHRKSEEKDPWHSARGRREIDYVFLNELWAIIKHNWAEFKALFPGQAWVESVITSDMNVSRRVLAHMNPLQGDDIKNIEAAFRKWVKQLQAVEDELP